MASTILIVEDDDANRTGLMKILKGAGYEVVGAATFEEGRQLLAAQHFDLLITDLRLGGFNGLQLLVSKPLPAIVITGYADPVLETEAKHLGAGFLVKPFGAAALRSLVEEKLGAQPQVTFDKTRRWVRKPIAEALEVRVDDARARVLDVSYGGLRFELDDTGELPPSFDINVPDKDLDVHVDLVWQSRTNEGQLLCGVALSQIDSATANAWHGLVDALA
jgi:DNA-binding response OmpR family regulator